MLLMDTVMETAAEVRKQRAQKDPVLGQFAYLESLLKTCPRFLLDDKATITACELTLSRPKIFREVMHNLRAPLPKMWVEWDDNAREYLRKRMGEKVGDITPVRPLPQRVGFLLECDDTGRKGMATWVWTTPPNEFYVGEERFPNIAPISPYFDLDRDDLKGYRGDKLIIAEHWENNPIQKQAMYSIWHTVAHRPSPWGKTILDLMRKSPISLGGLSPNVIENHAYADVVGEYIMLWGVIMMLTSHRKTIEYEQVAPTRINKHRIKRGKTPLLDHTTVHLYINETNKMRVKGTGRTLDYTRKSPRIHLVSSYLGYRGDKHWIVFPYMRGSGEAIARNVYTHG